MSDNWLDIDTAPEDGSRILVVADGETMTAYWDDGKDEEGEFYEEPGWWSFDGLETSPIEPTLWQPYPMPRHD